MQNVQSIERKIGIADAAIGPTPDMTKGGDMWPRDQDRKARASFRSVPVIDSETRTVTTGIRLAAQATGLLHTGGDS